MKPKRPKRSKRRSERPKQPAPTVAPTSPDTAATSPAERSAVSFTSALSGLTLRVCLVASMAIFVGLVILQISLRVRADIWPALDDVGLVPLQGAMIAGILVAASLAAHLAARSASVGKAGRARVLMVLAIACAGGFFFVRWSEYQSLYADGLWRRSIPGPIHERAGIYYLQAVGLRVEQLFNELEDRRIDQPDAFTEQDQRRLDVVSELERSLVSWTEHQVGHWLEDLDARRAAIELVARHIHPLAADRQDAAMSVEEHRRELLRRRSWFELLRDYCKSKLELRGSAASVAAAKPASSATDEQTPANDQPEAVAALDARLQSKLASLGLSDWSYARSVIRDAGSSAMIAERLNQIQAHLDAIAARMAFLDARQKDADLSLNRQHPWLRLPICLPGGNAWAGGFFALSSLHMLLLGFVVLLSVALMLIGKLAARPATWRHVQWWWHVAGMIAVVSFLLFYLA